MYKYTGSVNEKLCLNLSGKIMTSLTTVNLNVHDIINERLHIRGKRQLIHRIRKH